MPPKRRVVKTVRKTIPRSKSKPPPAVVSAAEENPTSPASPPPELATQPPSATAAETPPSELVEPTPEPPAVAAAASSLPSEAPPETAVATAAASDAAPETLVTHPSPAVEEPQPAAAEPSGAAKKTTVRVRKVIKKKIVKKRVPKVVPAAKEDLDSSQPPAETAAEVETPSTKSRPENPSSDAVAGEGVQADNVDVAEEQSVQREQDKEMGQEMAASEEKDAQREQHKEIGQEVAAAEGKDVPREQDKKMGQQVVDAEKDVQRELKEIGQEVAAVSGTLDEEAGMSERQKRRKTEIFIGGLGRDAKEDDLRNVFGKVGEIVEVRMMMDSQTGKNKGYAFLRYKEAAQAKKAVSEFSKVEICGKLCGAAPLEGNDTIFLGNIDKKWKKEDVTKVLQDIGIEKIDTLTVMADPHNADTNRGFAFLELETNKDAHIAYRKLQKKDIFGIGRNIKVAWAEPLNDPDEEEMQKVKSVYVEGVPSSWHESDLREIFKKFGEIERIAHSRDIQSAKRKDFAFVNYTTREAALSCIELFDKELTEDGSEVNIKVSLAKPVHKNKSNKGFSKSTITEKEKTKPMQREVKASVSSYKSFKDHNSGGGDKKASTTNELLQVLREQAAWKQGQVGYARGPIVQEFSHMGSGGKRAFPSMGDASYSDVRGYPRPRLDNSFPVSGPSYGAHPPGMPGSSLPYYQHSNAGYSGSHYGMPEHSSSFQNQGVPPYGSNMYTRYR